MKILWGVPFDFNLKLSMNEKNIILLFLTLGLFTSSFSQFQEGYVITNSNDTLYGYINFEGSLTNSRRCEFKSNQNDRPKIFLPKDIKAFRFNNSKYFVSKFINIDNENKVVFMEWLIKGRACILSYPNKADDIRFYLIVNNDSLCELKNSKENVEKDYGNELKTNYEIFKNEYKGILSYYFRDCKDIQKDIYNSQFTTNSLIKLAKTYHEKTCKTEDCYVFEDKKRKIEVAFGLTFSTYISQLFLESKIHQFQQAKSYGPGIIINLSKLPYLSHNFSIESEINYFNVTYSFDTNNDLDNRIYGSNKICKINLLRVPIEFLYKAPVPIIKPYIGIGFIGNFRFNNQILNEIYFNYVVPSSYTIDNPVGFLQYGINLKFGLVYPITKKISVLSSVEIERSFMFFAYVPTDNTSSRNYLIHCGVLYNFN